uniref:Protein arginine N-methyltransferase n=1 Tax=Eutreptiella gymnastica TaxID=73025 RepID=A0A7S1ITE0_9EUGL|mmetsp:Transcript_42163/g.75526  ORF Transcript_42163/g.75526 Transcript_42163/m.75526 type:complete len:318 (+) Transcript_42163:104-1057(+)
MVNSQLDQTASDAQKVFEAVLDISLHERMRDDVIRCNAYQHAIHLETPGKVVLDIGTGPFALLALMCARAGATRVYAMEVVEKWAIQAREAVKHAGYDHVVTVLHGFSTKLELPEKVDVVVHEILGNITSEEAVSLSIADARARLVRDPTVPSWSIPYRAQTWIAPITFVPIFEEGVEVPQPRRDYRLEQFPPELMLAPPQVWEDVAFCKPIDLLFESTHVFECNRNGTLQGLLNFMTVLFDEDGTIQINTLMQRTTWRVIAVLFGQEVMLMQGDRVAVHCKADVRQFPSVYNFEVTLHPGTNREERFDSRTVGLKM